MRNHMYKLVVVVGSVFLTALAINHAHWLTQPQSEAITTSPLIIKTIEEASKAESQPTVLSVVAKSPEVTFPSTPHSRLRIDQIIGTSTDLMSLLRNALPDAWRGEVAAQYYVSAILRACGDDLPSSTLEDRREQVERLQQAPQLSSSALDNIEKGVDRCKAIWQAARSDIGFGDDWLMKAAQGGFPQAMYDQAISIDPTISKDQRESFLQGAIDSSDPDVMRSIASEFFSADAESSIKSIAAAVLVACDFGADCGRDSDQLLALLPATSSVDSSEGNFTVQDWIDRDLSSADRQMLESQSGDFVARARDNQLGVGLTQDENERFKLSFTLAANGDR